MEERRVSKQSRGRKDKQITTDRNEIAHGGDIIGDIQAIQCAEKDGSRYVPEYKDFLAVYKIPFDDAVAKTPSYPEKVIRAFDIRASIHDLHEWHGSEIANDRQAIQDLAKEIIEAASNTKDRAPGHFNDIEKKFHEMDQLFRSRN